MPDRDFSADYRPGSGRPIDEVRYDAAKDARHVAQVLAAGGFAAWPVPRRASVGGGFFVIPGAKG